MTAYMDSRQLVSSFLAARENLDPNAADLMDAAFSFESPLMRIDDRDAYLQTHHAFQNLVKGMRMICELYGPDEACLLYDLDTTTPVGVQRTAEHFRIKEGKVASILLLFDSAPWRSLFEG